MKKFLFLFFTLFSFLTIAQDLTEVQKQQVDFNYLLNGGFENGKAGWSTYNDGASATPVDGVGGTANITLTTTATLPHDGKVSGVLTKDAVNRQGQGIKRDFTIPDIAKGKVVRLKFSYEITSGTYASGDASVWVYDVTNARLIQPSAYTIENSGLKESKFVEFQSSIDSNSYRLIVHVTSTSASAYTLKFDSFSIGLTPKIFGSVATDWISYTPTFTGFTTTSQECFYKRSGGDVLLQCRMFIGSTSATNFRVSLPTGFSISNTLTFTHIVGKLSQNSVNSANQDFNILALGGLTYVTLGEQSSNSGLTSVNATVLANVATSFFARIPIQGWSTTQQLSDDADNRVVALTVNGINSTSFTAGNNLVFDTVERDTHGAYNNATGLYTVRVSGFYRISLNTPQTTSVTPVIYVAKNGTFLNGTLGSSRIVICSTTVYGSGSRTAYFNAGDVISIRSDTTGAFASTSYVSYSIERISGPSQISASETVSALYSQSSGQSIPNASTVTVIYPTRLKDTHNAYNTSTGIFTAPTSGTYSIKARITYISSVGVTGNLFNVWIYKNNSPLFRKLLPQYVTGTALAISMDISEDVTLLAGETVSISANHDESSSKSLSTQATLNTLSITKIGNY